MISSASVEPSNNINAEIPWKMVTKGVRSTTRRPRKIAKSLIMGIQHDESGTEVGPSVAESEELGVAVLEHRFSEKVDHLPIKKRRGMQKSQSPSHRTLFDGTHASGQLGPDSVSGEEMEPLDGFVAVQRSKRFEKRSLNRKPPCALDSYGIQLLAAAACNTSIIDDVNDVKMGSVKADTAVPVTDASVLASSLENPSMSFEKAISPVRDSRVVEHVDSKDQTSSPSGSGNLHDKSDSEAGKGSSSGKDIRLHWDLNTVMDEWELPSDNMNFGSDRNATENIADEGLQSQETENTEGCVRQRNPEDTWEISKCPLSVEVSAQVISKSKCLDIGLYPGSDPISGGSPTEGKINTSTTKMAEQDRENCRGTAVLRLGRTLSWENVKVEKQDNVIVEPAVLAEDVSKMVRIKSEQDDKPELSSSGATLNLICTTLYTEDRSVKLGKAGPSQSPAVHDSMPNSDTTFKEGQTVRVIAGDNKNGSDTPFASADSLSEIELKKFTIKSYARFGEGGLEDLLDDGSVSDISTGGHDHLINAEKMSMYQAGCESPVEDGELRESVAHSWQENEGETDCLDYDMDDKDAAANRCMSEAGSDSNQIVNNVKSTEKVISGNIDGLKDPFRSVVRGNSGGRGRLPGIAEASNLKPRKENAAVDSTHKFDVKGPGEEKEGLRAIRGKLSAHGQGLLGSEAYYGKDTRDMRRESSAVCFQDGQVFRSDKYFGRDRFSRIQDEEDDVASGNLDSTTHHRNDYRRGGFNSSLRRNVLDSAENGDELNYDDQRRSRNYLFKDRYPPLSRRRHPDDEDNSMNKGSFATRDESHYGNRGRAGFYLRGFRKGTRDDYHEPIGDNPGPSSDWVPRNGSSRRQCSPSPAYNNRDARFSRPVRKSRSRSRSRSPIPWRFQKERHAGVRRFSRSPDFRPHSRMGRTKIHHEDSKFSEDDDGFFSPPRRCFSSSQGRPGFFNDRSGGPTRFRERDSPGRFIGQRQRFCSNGTPGRMKSDNYFKPCMDSERFSEQSGRGWRGHHNYDGSDSERPRYNDKHEMIRRVRHSETGGAGRRFRNDAEDCFEDHYPRNDYNGGNRSVEKNDTDGNSWDGKSNFKYDNEKSNFKYDNDRMQTTSSKPLGVRDYDKDAPVGGRG